MSEEKKNNKLMDNLFKLPFLKRFKNVKHIEIIVCIIFIGLLLLIYYFGFNKTVNTSSITNNVTEESVLYTSSVVYARELETKLEGVITELKGVTSARVMVSVKSGGEVIIANEITEESVKSNNGETINVTVVKTPIIVTENGESKPIVLMEVLPELEGVVVVAGGAEDTFVKLNILRIIQAMTNISSENIQVFAGN